MDRRNNTLKHELEEAMKHRIAILSVAFILLACAARAQDEKANDYFSDPRVLELALAAEKGDVARIDALVKGGVDVNAKGRHDMTPLMYTFIKKNKEGYSALLRHKADPNLFMSDSNADAVMNLAAAAKDPFWLQEALKHGGNPNLISAGNKFTKGDSPLYYAILEARPENVKLLVKAKADVNHKNGKRRFPLLLAAGRQRYDIVYLLLETNADFRQKDHNDDDLVQWVSRRNGNSIESDEQRKWFFKSVDFMKAKGAKFELRKD
jgi:ankyrin repeat protein